MSLDTMARADADDPRTLALRQSMSALADGELADAAHADAACAAWRDEPEARRAWHRYQLIGDVLRSAELASAPARDEAFLNRLRLRLATEPTVLAPAPLVAAAPVRQGRAWWAPVAVAAGFVAVAGVLVVTRVAAPGGDPMLATQTPQLAAAPRGLPSAALVSTNAAFMPTRGASAADPRWQAVDGQLIRDARLDSYLRAHRGVAAAVPGGAVGRFETVVLER